MALTIGLMSSAACQRGANLGDITEPKLSQHYRHKIKAYDELFQASGDFAIGSDSGLS